MATHTPTPEQEAVYDAVANTTGHVICEAVAGSGKSTTAVQAVGHVPAGKSVGFVAFNKSIANELKDRLGNRATATTLHSHGYAAVRRHAGSGVRIEAGKYSTILASLRADWFRFTRFGVPKPTTRALECLALIDKLRETLTPWDNREAIADVCDRYDLDTPGATMLATAVEVITRGMEQTAVIDFTDMLWLPVMLSLPLTRYDVLFCDECQDFSKLMQEVAVRSGERLVILGDRNQSIYGFNGADPDAMPGLMSRLSQSPVGACGTPLTVTFRCPRWHVQMAQRIVPHIQAAETADRGECFQISSNQLSRLVRSGDLVIGRTNAGLVTTTLGLISQGTPAVMVGRDFGTQLAGTVRRMNAGSITELLAKIEQYRDRESSRLESRNAAAARITALHDRCDALTAIAEKHDTVDGMIDGIGRLFADADSPLKTVRVSSIHRAKGTEANAVFMVDTANIPMRRKEQQPWEVEQERNIAYVAVTRGKRQLWFVGSVPTIYGAADVRPFTSNAA